ncbi:(R)-mandelonitrile lyase [Sphingomonas rubra]|uniref:4-carboxymuconolactone decarboxylase n=1 Tax=Sphingomonas rubra TaxID=634430 RepID=A0A1I5TBV4_9SPHN|nr:carboxymuconolactone decarboxylase family protein [Sphingomonas rubra]SFP80301.1 4-carboxymuconolactone decarboxylase [Sphingomonas rubra]
MKRLGMILSMIAVPASAQQARSGSVAPPAMQRIAPGLAGYTDGVLFGDVWRRPQLAPRDRSLVTVAVLIATGKTAQLEGHLGRALDNGVTPGEVSGIVTHLAFYSGWPNAVSSLEVIERVFHARHIAASNIPRRAGAMPLPASDGDRAKAVEATVAPTAPKLAALTNDVLFRDLWLRTDLAPRDRSLLTIAALAAGGDGDQLAFHVKRGIENGLTHDQIGEALTHLAFYAGWPKAMAAVAVAAKAMSDEGNPPATLTIVPGGSEPARGPASNFTGAVTTDTPFRGTGGSKLGGARVTFRPGARSNWHTHPFGQLLLVTDGRGLIQEQGGRVWTMHRGDVVWTAPGVRHWHGAAPDSAMSHVAVSESVEGEQVAWAEAVSDAEYRQAPVN